MYHFLYDTKKGDAPHRPPPASDYYLARSFFTTPIAMPTMPAQKNVNRIALPVIVVITVLTTSIKEPTAVVIVLVPASANNIDILLSFLFYSNVRYKGFSRISATISYYTFMADNAICYLVG